MLREFESMGTCCSTHSVEGSVLGDKKTQPTRVTNFYGDKGVIDSDSDVEDHDHSEGDRPTSVCLFFKKQSCVPAHICLTFLVCALFHS